MPGHGITGFEESGNVVVMADVSSQAEQHVEEKRELRRKSAMRLAIQSSELNRLLYSEMGWLRV